eukprot:4577765-Amphidinium_carterae.1
MEKNRYNPKSNYYGKVFLPQRPNGHAQQVGLHPTPAWGCCIPKTVSSTQIPHRAIGRVNTAGPVKN